VTHPGKDLFTNSL